MSGLQKQLENKQETSDCYETVCHIEYREIIPEDLKIKKIDDIAVSDAIDKIADGSRDNQKIADDRKQIALVAGHQQIKKNYAGDDRQSEKKCRCMLKNRETCTVVSDMRQIEKILDQHDHLVQFDICNNCPLGKLIKQNKNRNKKSI